MIDMIIGPMGSGKSKAILDFRRETLEKFPHLSVICIKPKIDTRNMGIRSRDGQRADAFEVESFKDILDIVKDNDNSIFIIDEVQFLNEYGFSNFVKYVQVNDIPVIASGLNQTSDMTPFEVTAKLCMFADSVTVLSGKCVYCGSDGKCSKCTVEKSSDILVGDDVYQQTCYKCFYK